jgi:hypothetical protein
MSEYHLIKLWFNPYIEFYCHKKTCRYRFRITKDRVEKCIDTITGNTLDELTQYHSFSVFREYIERKTGKSIFEIYEIVGEDDDDDSDSDDEDD